MPFQFQAPQYRPQNAPGQPPNYWPVFTRIANNVTELQGAAETIAYPNVAVTLVTANYTASPTDYIIQVTITGMTVTLPLAQIVGSGKTYIVKSLASITTTVTCSAAQTIDGVSSITVVPLSALHVYTDGTNWWTT